MNKEDICFTRKMEKILKEEIRSAVGDVYEKHQKVEEFLKRDKTAEIIKAEDLGKHDVALFQTIVDTYKEEGFQAYSISNILVDFQIDGDKVTAKKLYRFRCEYELETRTYFLSNYGKTWRAWAALPKRREAEAWE